MKTVALILGLLGISFSGVAQVESNQKQSDLKGPAFKNYKVWMDQSEPIKVYSENNKKSLVGPAYKNQQAWTTIPKENLAVVKTAGNERQKLTGPAFKNFGPWSKDAK
jgi:hypothetical protein